MSQKFGEKRGWTLIYPVESPKGDRGAVFHWVNTGLRCASGYASGYDPTRRPRKQMNRIARFWKFNFGSFKSRFKYRATSNQYHIANDIKGLIKKLII